MIKILALPLIALFFLPPSAYAQKGKTSLSIGPSVGIPLNFATGYKTGFGGGIRGYFGVTTQGSVMANVNTLSFDSKFGYGTGNFTSVKVGYKTNFNSDKLFIYGDGGLILKSASTGGGRRSDFGMGGGIGYSFPAGRKGSIDVVPSANIVFQKVINRTWLDLHLAYRFHLR